MLTTVLRKRKAVTLTELLVVVAIIALLSTMAVPVYINQLQRARIATAQMETRNIAQAMEACAITHGFMVPIHILNNVPNQPAGSPAGNQIDSFDNLPGNGSDRFIIDISRPLEDQTASDQFRLNENNQRVRQMIESWQGPFLNPKRIGYVGQTVGVNLGDRDKDLVLDPWGNPYRVWSERGLLGSDTPPGTTGETLSLGMDDLAVPTSGSFGQHRFDRYAILSFGPNGVWGDGTAGTQNSSQDFGDDIYSTFVINPGNESRYQFF